MWSEEGRKNVYVFLLVQVDISGIYLVPWLELVLEIGLQRTDS